MKSTAKLLIILITSLSFTQVTLAEKSQITITKALWRSTGSGNGPDVTAKVAELCNGSVGACQLVCSNALFENDPEYGRKKECQISFKCEGGSSKTIKGNEDTTVTLDCK